MKRFLPVAVVVALVGAIVAVVVISGGDEEGPKQPSVEQQVSPADDLSPSLRKTFRQRFDIRQSRVSDVRCGNYGEIRQRHGRGPVPALARPPDEECFVYVQSARTYHFIRFGHRWTYIPPGVVL